MNKFKFDSIKIEKKKYLIEASAGTGKTHSMGQIFIRLIIEGFSPEKILLVTFTNAAAEEIKERILIFLIEVKSYLKDGDIEKINKIKNDKDLLNYLKNIREDKDLEKRIKYIDNAIFNFDKIYTCTIHSFAINLVKEFSNEIGLPFVNEFGKSSKNIDNLILQKYLLEKYITSRNYLEKLLKSIKDKEDKEKLKKIIKELKKVKDFYENFKVSPNKNLDKNIESAKNPSNKNNDEVIDNLYSLKEDFLKFYSLNSLNIKKKYGIFNFNDSMELLLNLFNSNESIRKKISDRFDLLIIDEFQDSDENQVKLFETLFSGKTVFYIGDPKQAIYGFRGGDFINYLNIKKNIPEDCQYILNQSYRSTAKVIDFINQFSEIIFNESKKENESEDDQENEIEIDKSKVEKNKKNSKKINKEDNAEKIIREIKDLLKYEKVESDIQESKGKNEAKLIKITKDEETNETNEKNIEKEKSKASKKLDYIENKKVAFWIKEKIEELQYEDSEFKYENTAILLKNNDDIDKFYKFFTEFGLPCALKQQKSVFETDEAIFIYYLLSAILNKDDIKYIKRLLSTPYFDYTYDEIIKKIGIIYPDYLYVLRYLHECWKELGIYSIFENIFLRFKLNIKGFTIYDYERKLTNIRQIFEVLTNYFEKKNLSLYDQIEILKELIKGEDEDFDKDFDDISSMRIESEENAIIISTIHSAKGLEYDTVFCPNIDFNSKNKYPAIFYYKKNNEFYK
jgi:exodeoxyribonuclease V beta subunit